jgi:hypothetical protein
MARFQTGHPKPPGSGRKRGTPNKKTLGLQESLEAHGLNLIGQLVNLLPDLHIDKQADVLLELMAYVYPRRKSVEVSGMNEAALSEPLVILTMPRNGREAPAEKIKEETQK